MKSLQIPSYNEVHGRANKIYGNFLKTSRKIKKGIDLNTAAWNSGMFRKTQWFWRTDSTYGYLTENVIIFYYTIYCIMNWISFQEQSHFV